MSHARHHTPKGNPHPLLMWYARCPTLTALGLIANRGVFQREFLRENISILPVRDNGDEAVRKGHFDHSLPHLVREADAATALWAQSQGARSSLMALGATYQSVSLVVRGSAYLKGLSDLKGLKLSVPKETGPFSPARARALRAWENVLDFAGLTPSDITFADVEAGAPSLPFGDVAQRELSALARRTVDVVILYGAKGLETIRNQGLNELYRFSPDAIHDTPKLEGLIEQRALTLDPLLLEAHPDAVSRVLERLTEVPQWAANFPREALNQAGLEAGVSLEDADLAYGGLLPQSTELGLEAQRLQRLERLRLWLADRGLINKTTGQSPIAAWMEPPKVLHPLDDLARA